MAKAETTVETVKMDDERIVEFTGKRRLNKESFVDAEGNILCRLDFRNGETRTFKLPQTLVAKAAAHGIEQKLGDEMSGIEDLEDAIQAVDELMERLGKGEWNAKREGGTGFAGASILARALVEATGKTIEEVKAFMSGLTNGQKLALRGDETLAPIVKRLEAEKAARATKGKPAVDTGSLLAGLKSGESIAATE